MTAVTGIREVLTAQRPNRRVWVKIKSKSSEANQVATYVSAMVPMAIGIGIEQVETLDITSGDTTRPNVCL